MARAVKRVKNFLFGRPLPSERLEHERLNKKTALAVLSSDAISSVAYATDQILIVLAVLGTAAAVNYAVPISAVIVGLLILVGLSYRQTIFAYPNGGGSYTVAKENLGTGSGLLAAAALLTDYIMTVAVSIAGGIAAIGEAGGGVLLYLAQEGRGIGLVNKLRAYQLQDAGFDTVDANEQLGFDADERVYLPAAEMLRQLGVTGVRLLTNNPDKVAALERYGIPIVERVPHVFPSNGHNERYLETKATRSGHLL